MRVQKAALSPKSGNDQLSFANGHLFNHPLLHFYHARRAGEKREQMETDEMKMKVFNQHKWSIIKGMRQELLKVSQARYLEKQRVRLYITQRVLDKGLRALAVVLARRIEYDAWCHRSKYLSLRFYQGYKRYSNIRGYELSARNLLYSRQVIIFTTQSMIHDACESRSKEIITVLFKKFNMVRDFLARVRDTLFQIIFI